MAIKFTVGYDIPKEEAHEYITCARCSFLNGNNEDRASIRVTMQDDSKDYVDICSDCRDGIEDRIKAMLADFSIIDTRIFSVRVR